MIFLTITSLLFSVQVIAQQTALNDGVSVNFPDGTQKITKEYALDHAEKKFHNNKLAQYSYHDVHSKYMYKIDDIILILFPSDKTFNFEKGNLIATKKGLDELNHSNNTYISYIKRGVNNSTIVIRYIVDDLEYYGIYCYNDNNTRALGGTLEFKTDEESEATNVLNNLLASIRFKD